MINIWAHCPFCRKPIEARRQPDGSYLMYLAGKIHPWGTCQKEREAAT